MENRNGKIDRARLGFARHRKISAHASGTALCRFSGGTFSALNVAARRQTGAVIFRLSAESRYAKLNRQAHGESCSSTFLASPLDRAAVLSDNRPGNRQAETGVACAGARLVGAEKAAENQGQICGGNPPPGVGHR